MLLKMVLSSIHRLALTSYHMKINKIYNKISSWPFVNVNKCDFSSMMLTEASVCRSTDCVELHHEGHGAPVAHWNAGRFCHRHLRHHWARALSWQDAQDLLLQGHRSEQPAACFSHGVPTISHFVPVTHSHTNNSNQFSSMTFYL